jgi:nitrilase
MRAAAVQFAPVFLDTPRTLEKMLARLEEAGRDGAGVVAFPETALSGYPVWIEHTDGARFEDPGQKAAYAAYLDCAVEENGPELARLTEAARDLGVLLFAGIVERGSRRGRGSVWAGLFSVGPEAEPLIHRKLVPTHEERLIWSHGDAHGLVTRSHRGVRVGGLNCWENWMPLPRAALYEDGEELHVSIWPGSPDNTREISRFTALEGRVFVIAACGVLRGRDVPASFPLRAELVSSDEQILRSGGSRIVAPDGTELGALDDPVEGILTADCDLDLLRRERQSRDPSGHYSRPELLELRVDRARYR